ncbi:hypothetical protein [Gloeobacter kilaueensis]|uniref:Uncharacterized protein n=1 Tax=Gloeobacter kilaueensis (strain ATCC BAA-2537 / CCAP 1431/1 / ULC 316 / JS1) TaxID=1183438 RepID=U5QDL2_GLOK1|nr:hypothetical protein [Gloeobacter kilaueensis]AGY57027.1 hypothetical protein GKIL_0781 [Gloeobacter kilaueensis JS1]
MTLSTDDRRWLAERLQRQARSAGTLSKRLARSGQPDAARESRELSVRLLRCATALVSEAEAKICGI